ncbi:thioredoxin fold domain-containing protein [Piscinibacter sakaiensis]|uniref:thioredoxin fold domain-containing protein n=1 Tax=Piscinibacter sakaiensis TaxID=1547922 RepID=UPI003AAC27A0
MTFRPIAISCLLMLALAAQAAPSGTPAGASAAAQPATVGIDWLVASRDADVDAAFARAKAERKPLFLYWGAKWCPPCNHVQATLFNRQEFIARSRAFVPVYVDGDKPGAQRLGERFKVRGYPTMVLFSADGAELIRLPGEVAAQQYTEVLSLGMAARRPLKAVVADARDAARSKSVDAAEWRMLSFYSWGTDEQQIVPKAELAQLLQQLAANAPDADRETADRLWLRSLAASRTKTPSAEHRDRLIRLLDDPARARAQMDLLGNDTVALVKATSAEQTPQRQQLIARFELALDRLATDASLSRADRLGARLARVELLRLDLDSGQTPKLPASLLTAVRAQVERDDREITDGYERQAVITSAAYLLARAGLLDESDRLLKANLAKSHSPYYLMSGLASNARARGDNADALRWYAQAHQRSVGSATRLQWGASHLAALIDLAPQAAATIEAVASQVLDDAADKPDAFYERSGRSLKRVSSKLLAWADEAQDQAKARAALGRLQRQLDSICGALPAADAARTTCQALLRPAAAGKAS